MSLNPLKSPNSDIFMMHQYYPADALVGLVGSVVIAYLGGGHFTDRAMRLNSLQLVQAPVQLLQRIQGELLVLLV